MIEVVATFDHHRYIHLLKAAALCSFKTTLEYSRLTQKAVRSPYLPSLWVKPTKIRYIKGERVIKSILGLCIGLPKADPNRATWNQLLVNPKSLRCKSFLQHKQGGAVCAMYIMSMVVNPCTLHIKFYVSSTKSWATTELSSYCF